MKRAYNFIDLKGMQFGNWTVGDPELHITKSGIKVLKWNCFCKCGTKALKNGYVLRAMKGSSKSSSCQKCYLSSLRGIANHSYRHGMSKTNIYKIWSGILSRCNNPKVRIYKYYGGRGIVVCKRWENFGNFYEDMGDRPPKHQIDRIDNNKGYSPENCRWVLPKENNPANKGDLPDDMPGKKFGHLLVLKLIKHRPGLRCYECKCSCGKKHIAAGSDLRRGKVWRCKDCGAQGRGIAIARGWKRRREVYGKP